MENKNTVISVIEIAKIIKKNIWIIISIIALCFTTMFISVNYLLTPEYRATTQILIVPNTAKQDSNSQNSEVQANLQMISTYSAMLKSPLILNDVSHKFNGEYSTSVLKKKIVVANDQNSQILNIHVEDPNQKVAATLANQVATSFKEKLPKVMTDKTVTVMSKAEILKQSIPVFPNKKIMYMLSIIVGIILSIGVCFVRMLMDTTIKTEEQITEKLNLIMLGSISNIPDSILIKSGGKDNEAKQEER
ncbi:YveK family protein [Listeria booriae]|uniref:Uncharacterized protein n=1 Tax=Listeria booriae TaxID=1552123 RepID=A0A7X0XIA3_9LIST|nr:Wzz/FepE/Etk N-terminal domain-containing protein [Listeria booriae]MBC1561544.1 hypothetical protein [Listeria booriae]MBC1574027.1 hypothetical protein [Listeria booriae]MBC2321751.1 hypothetical protein [Listeria booriae]MCD2205758.1 hypothetical protein [Listeria booriae]